MVIFTVNLENFKCDLKFTKYIIFIYLYLQMILKFFEGALCIKNMPSMVFPSIILNSAPWMCAQGFPTLHCTALIKGLFAPLFPALLCEVLG